MSVKRTIKSIFTAIYTKPYTSVYVLISLISLIVGVWGWVYLFIKFIKHPTFILGAFLIACILYPIFSKHTKEFFKNITKKG